MNDFDYNRGVSDAINEFQKVLKKTSKLDSYALEILESMVKVTEDNKNIEEAVKNLRFMLDGNVKAQRLLAWMTANYLTVGASTLVIDEEKRIKFYSYRIEEKLRDILFYDMSMHEYRYLKVIIELFTTEKVREFVLQERKYTKKLVSVMAKVEELQSSLIGRELGICYM